VGTPELFAWTVPPTELIARGTLIYLGLVLCFRFLLRRDIGSMSTADLLFVVLIADAAQNAMAGEYKSVGDGAVLVATLIFWNVVLDWLAYRSAALRRILEPPPLPLIKNGRWIRANLKQQWITTEEVEAKLREHGIESVAQVKAAFLEPDGELGVIKRSASDDDGTARKATDA
jgi:uncharacterized membrane protein YcaP (DUF421 family)